MKGKVNSALRHQSTPESNGQTMPQYHSQNPSQHHHSSLSINFDARRINTGNTTTLYAISLHL